MPVIKYKNFKFIGEAYIIYSLISNPAYNYNNETVTSFVTASIILACCYVVAMLLLLTIYEILGSYRLVYNYTRLSK